MSTYRSYLFDMVTDKGDSIVISSKGSKGELLANITLYHNLKKVVVFKNMDVLQNFILINSDKGLNNESNLDKLAHILYTSEVVHYE